MLSHWNFDPVMIDVASLHDKLDRTAKGDQVDLVEIVQVANVLSYGDQPHHHQGQELARVPAFQRVGAELIAEVREKVATGEGLEIGDVLH